MSPPLSIVIPIHNEESNLPELIHRVCKVLDAYPGSETILVNDGSSDRSLDLLKGYCRELPGVHYLSLSRNFGHQAAIWAGMCASRGNRIVVMDGDLQDPPELIHNMMARANEGYRVVYAKRKSRRGETWLKKFTARLFYRILSRITPIDIPLDTGDFRLIDRRVMEELKAMGETQKFLRGQIAWLGFRQTYVLFDRDKRHGGNTQYSLKKMLKLALAGITGFSTLPLKLASLLGFAVAGISFVLLVYALVSKMLYMVPISGWTSLMITVSFIGGVQLLSLGIIGEYISRINEESRKRPVYIVDESSIDDKA
jgi:dolichol-phosphate mannosyltransferase